MSTRKRFGVLAGFLVILNGAGLLWIRHELTGGSAPKIRVLSALPIRNVDEADRFTLVFDEPLVADDRIGTRLERTPFVIEPQPPGHWRWIRSDQLAFMLDAPLLPGRRFTLKPSGDLEDQLGRVLVGESEYRFETRPLRLLSCELGPTDRDQTTVELTFNQPVSPTSALEHLTCCDAGNDDPLVVTALTEGQAERLAFRCERPLSERLSLRLAADLTGPGAQLGLGKRIERELHLPKGFTLLRAEVDRPSLDLIHTVELAFSHDLDREQPLPEVRVDPPVDGLQVRYSYSGLEVEGPFEFARDYTLTVGPEVRSEDGELLGEEQHASFVIPDRRPSIHLPANHGVLSPDGHLQLDVTLTNVAGLEISAHRLHANNLAAHVRGDRPEVTSRPLETKTIPLDLDRNEVADMTLDLREILGGKPGVYQIVAEATDRSWTDASAIVTISDLGITCKRERDGYLVWVTSLRTADPTAGAEVQILSYSNQVIGKAATGSDGVARVPVPRNHPDGEPWLITARSGENLSFFRPDTGTWVIDGVDTTGRAHAETYDVMLYTERGVYRPGDTIHLTGLIRDRSGSVPDPFPLAITVTRPDGRDVTRLTATPRKDGQGMLHVDFTTDEEGQLGPYRFVATLPGSEQVLGRTRALVEAFMPVRMEVNVSPGQACYGPGDAPTIDAAARYLFGKPASGLTAEVAGAYRRESFESKKYPDYRFTDPAAGEYIEIRTIATQLDDHGEANVALSPVESETPGLWHADVNVTVTESGGRSVSGHTPVRVDTAERHVGIRLPVSNLLIAGETSRVDWVQLDAHDEYAEAGPMQIALSRVEYDTVVQRVDGRWVWKSVENVIPVTVQDLDFPEIEEPFGVFEFVCPMAGVHRLHVTDCYSGSVTQIQFHVVSDRNGMQSVAMNEPERLDIALDSDRYVPGTEAKVLVRSPFVGTMLLTLETDRVIDRQVIDMADNTVETYVPIPENVRGGAYLTATVIRPVNPSDTNWLPHRAMGMTRVATDHTYHKLPVSFEIPEKARPGEAVRVAVKTERPMDPSRPGQVHLWAVDEGILLTTAYDTPNPFGHFFAPRAPFVESADGLGELLPDYKRPVGITSIGAGEDKDAESLRRSPVALRRREPAVVWRGAAPIGANGTVDVDMKMPELTGEMRIMAVVVDHDRYGSCGQGITVTAPLLVEPSWPRFVAPGDRFDVPVKLFNSTEQTFAVDLEFEKTEGPIRIHDTAGEAVTVTPDKPTTVWYTAEATGMGQIMIRTRARTTAADGESLSATHQADFMARPAAPIHSTVSLMRVQAGESVTLTPPDELLAGTVHAKLSIGARPSVQLAPALEQLIEYPYGCVEQTTSRLIALLRTPELLRSRSGNAKRADEVERMIRSGIARLWSMQTASGGLAYWPGGTRADAWGSAYAASFLLDAKRAGYELNRRSCDALAGYLRSVLESRDDNQPDDNTRALFCDVLAAFGKPHSGWMARLSEKTGELDMAGRAHLAAAWIESGRKDRAREVLADDTLHQIVSTTTGGRLTSQVRQEAVLLNVLIDLDENHPWIVPLVQRLESARKDGAWGSTLENGAALSALARYQTLDTQEADFEGEVRTATTNALAFDHKTPATFSLDADDLPVEITSDGSGGIYLSVVYEGLTADDTIEPYDRQLLVRRHWFNADGEPVDPATLRVGDLVHVKVELASPELPRYECVQNVCIVDALPGGMEVENPRLATSSPLPEDDEPSDEADRVEFQDDRVVLFASAEKKESVFRYGLRVISVGSFTVPPVQASCMYDTAYASLHGGGRITVAP